MAGYVRKVRFTVNFDKQQIDVALKPLLFMDLLKLRTDKQEEAIAQYAQMLPGYVEELSPILDSDGNRVTIEDIATAAYFGPLVTQLFVEHVKAATAGNP
jgi:hypothetical protein